jgi:hypothetical protein
MKWEDELTTTLIACVRCNKGYKIKDLKSHKDGGLCCKTCYRKSWEEWKIKNEN